MKRTIKLFLVVALMATSVTLVNAQKAKKPFSGTITFALSYDGVEPAQLAQMPTSTVMKISENKQKTTVDLGQYAYVSVTDGDIESSIFWIDVMGQKLGYNLDKATLDKAKTEDTSPKPVITKSEETKEIAGVKCNKMTIVSTDEETGDVTTSTIWYSEELGFNEKLNFMSSDRGITGIVLGTETSDGKMTNKSYATLIKKEKIKSTEFLIPADAEMSKSVKEFSENMKAKFGGGGGDDE